MGLGEQTLNLKPRNARRLYMAAVSVLSLADGDGSTLWRVEYRPGVARVFREENYSKCGRYFSLFAGESIEEALRKDGFEGEIVFD